MKTEMMKRLTAIFLFLLMMAPSLAARSRSEMVRVDFALNSVAIDPTLGDNGAGIAKLRRVLMEVASADTLRVSSISLLGSASPEGDYALNLALSRRRMAALEEIIGEYLPLNETILSRNDSYIPWDELLDMVEGSDLDGKQRIREIVESPSKLVDCGYGRVVDSRVRSLKALDGGKTWQTLDALFFSKMRSATVVIHTESVPDEPESSLSSEETGEPCPLNAEACGERLPEGESSAVEVLPEAHHWYLKTNGIAWLMLIQNIAVEVDLGDRFSVALPIYYSGLTYFVNTIKFQTFAVQPELRFWTRSNVDDGLFLGVHGSMAFFNVAWNGDYRYQDHDAKTPALGGGVNIGYRFALSSDKRWKMEVDLGGGVYHLNYDKFYNGKNEPLVATGLKRTFICVDRVSLSVGYTFDLKKSSGKGKER